MILPSADVLMRVGFGTNKPAILALLPRWIVRMSLQFSGGCSRAKREARRTEVAARTVQTPVLSRGEKQGD
jgi:hypothetical protein